MIKMIITIVIFLFVGALNGLPFGSKFFNDQKLGSEGTTINPDVLTIERLEALLKTAIEIFKPATIQRSNLSSAEIQKLSVPVQFLQPPANQPFSFYMPLFDYDEKDVQTVKLDDKSRSMGHFTPPPIPKGEHSQQNFYSIKPKKYIPKKFNSSDKHINISWLNAFEKQLSSQHNKEATDAKKDVYLLDDERNRINFDDNFFTADMKVSDQTNKLDESLSKTENQTDDYVSQGASADVQVPLIT